MGSVPETNTTWQGWSSCLMFSSQDHQLSSQKSFKFDKVTLNEAFDRDAIVAFCRANNVPATSLFGAAWSIVLGAYTGSEEVSFLFQDDGAVVQNAVRSHLDPASNGRKLSISLQQVEFTPQLSPTKARNHVFDTRISILRDDLNGTSEEDDANARMQELGILLSADLHYDNNIISITYSSELYTQQQALRTAGLLAHCIQQIATHDSTPVRSLDILPPSDASEIYHWNSKPLPTWNVAIHQAVAHRAAQAPDSQAICAWDGNYTFNELDSVSSRLARNLQAKGIKQGSAVAFLFDKSKWTIVSVLAIFKLGCAAVALNSEYPMERMRKITELASAEWALVDRGLEKILDISGVRNIVVDDTFLEHSRSSLHGETSFICPEVEASDMAFIQFTSGSSGQPKGIVIEHGSFMANAMGHLDAIRLNRESRTLQCAAHTFDAFLTEVMMTLLAGACVCIPSEDDRMNDLTGAARRFNANWMGMTPTLAKVLRPQDVPDLKTLCLWGEAASRELIATWADSVELINCYGPSENSVGATTHSFTSGSRASSSIGKAVATVNTWVVRPGNPDLLAPIGAVGELVLQGPTVARGYIGEAEKTKHSFRTGAPWLMTKDTNSRSQHVYLTGDLVRYRVDGTLEFLGRQDTAVKIRGQRIELGEIEHNIIYSEIPYNAAVALVVGSPTFSIERLIAFVSDGSNSHDSNKSDSVLIPASEIIRTNAANLEAHLSRLLTQAAVPSLFIPLRKIPTLASGKVDRQKLLAAIASLDEDQILEYSTQAPSIKETPKGQSEHILAELWAEVLATDVTKISRHDNFFFVGGNSILAMRLTVAARAKRLALTVAQVLNNPVLKDLAALVSSSELAPDAVASGYSPFSTISAPLVKAFMETVVTEKLDVAIDDIEDIGLATDYQVENLAWSSLKKRGGTNYTTLDFSASLDPQHLQAAFERLQSHHAILRSVYFVHHRQVYQAALKKAPLQVTQIVNSPNVFSATETLMKEDLRQPLDISQPFAKLWLIIAEGGVRRLVLRASHLQYDGVAMIQWCKELGQAYRSLSELKPAPSFLDYTYCAANHNASDACAYWKDLLAGSSMTNVFDHPSVPWKHVLDGQVDTMIDSKLLQCQQGITGGTVIKASWALVLSEMAKTDDVVFGSVVWGRNAPYVDVESVSGACINNIPVRLRLPKDMTRLSLLEQVQNQYFKAVDYECFQYKRIVSECTEWKPWERLATLVEYENLGEDTSSFPIDGNKHFTVDEIRPPADRHDITIYSMPLGDQTFIALDYCEAAIDQVSAQAMLDRMIAHITSFKHDINGFITSSKKPESLPEIPLPLNNETTRSLKTNGAHQAAVTNGTNGVSHGPKRDNVSRAVESAWRDVLACRKKDVERIKESRTPFFQVWGDLIAAVGLAKWYAAEGYSVSMEDILQNPDMESQEELLRASVLQSSM